MNARRLFGVVVVAMSLLGATNASAWGAVTTGAPFSDPSAHGYIGLCNSSLHQVRSGDIDTTPFATRAVSSVSAPSEYAKPGRTAILLAYQPIAEVPSGEWSGEELTASSRYTNAAHPMAEATAGDDSLADFISDFPPLLDHSIELRLYLGAINEPVYSYSYPSLAIEVTGTTWHQVGGGPVDCTNGSATSIETILLGTTTTTTTTSTSPATTSGTHPGGTSTSTTPASTATSDPVQALNSNGTSGGDSLVLGVAIGLAALAALILYVSLRRRRLAVSAPPNSITSDSPTERHHP
jgi:hypothetical protein